MGARVTALALLVFAGVAGFVAWSAATAPRASAGHAATDEESSSCAATVAGNEGLWRKESAQDFPADSWSQRDAFHGREAQQIRDLARTKKIPYEEVIRAVDEDVHRMHAFSTTQNADRSAIAVPCKPRPFYD